MNLSGNPIDYLVVFSGGVILSFTPCVYPLVPISAGYIAANSGGSRLKGLILSLVYVTGMAVTYSILGLIAALTGKIFGTISTHPVTYICVGIVIIIFGLSMLDLFQIPLVNFLRFPVTKKPGYFSAFLLGLNSGLAVTPCTTPALGTILAYLATKRNILYGATLLFTFAYGMGLILILSGVFSTALLSLPKSGKWLVYVKRLAALILVGMGAFFIFTGIRRM